jgi:small subunit ribosomal protein S1
MSTKTEENFPEDMQQLLDSIEFTVLRRGDIVEGSVMKADSDGIFIDVGQKNEGFIPANEMRTLPSVDLLALKEGDPIIAFVIKSESQDGPLLSIDKAKGEEGWRELQRYQEDDQPIQGEIIGFNRGGCILEVANVQGFVPMSQLVTISRKFFKLDSEDGDTTPNDKEQAGLLGHKLVVKVLEVNRARNRAIFSERAALQEQRDEQKAELIQHLQEGDIRKGIVTGISHFGAFVDLGGADGLIHISEMSWSMVQSPSDVVTVGEELDVYILRIDREAMKIALSLRRMSPKPWETIEDRYSVGDVVTATITKLANFGAFAKLEDTIEGLIHITELSNDEIEHPKDVISEGDQIQVKILQIEIERKRLGLSLIQATTPGVIIREHLESLSGFDNAIGETKTDKATEE